MAGELRRWWKPKKKNPRNKRRAARAAALLPPHPPPPPPMSLHTHRRTMLGMAAMVGYAKVNAVKNVSQCVLVTRPLLQPHFPPAPTVCQ
jgi:hypothetical protein